MGRGCYTDERRDLVIVGNWCPNKCFRGFGECGASELGQEKSVLMCELRPEMKDKIIDNAMLEILSAVKKSTVNGRSVFLYTPDMFNRFYLEAVLRKLPDNPAAYIAVNACVHSFIKANMPFDELRKKGIKEIWFGIESGSQELRNRYSKPYFTNNDVLRITNLGRDAGVNICWFMVDGFEDTPQTRLETFNLMVEAQPFRFHFSPLLKAA